MLKGFDPFDAAVIYGTTGGTPLYPSNFNPRKACASTLPRMVPSLGFFF